MVELINRKKAGQPITRARSDDRGNVIDLMEALRRSLGKSPDADRAVKPAAKAPAQPTAKAKKPRKRIAGQTEMLLPIAGKGAGKKAAAKPAAAEKKPARSRKAG
jgi:DNA end-binding protein Ku